MFAGAAVQDTGDDTYVIQPFKSDFSVPSMDKMVFLSVVGVSSETKQTWISVFLRKSDGTDDRHRLRAVMSPRANYYERLDYYGSSKNLSLYPMASTTDWNAIDVMLSYDERSIYVFFSYTFDFIGKCSLVSPNITNVAADSTAPPYTIPASECTYLSPKAFAPASVSDAGITGASFTLKGCVRMTPMHFLACLYDMQGAKAMLYAVDERRDGGPKTVLDTYDLAYAATSENIGRPKSPPAWDPSTKRVYYMIDLNSGNGMGLRYVVNATTSGGGIQSLWATVYGASSSGILWRGLGSDSSNYHSLVFMRGTSASAPGAAYTASLVAACTPPMCAEQLSFVSFTGSFSLPSERTAMAFPGSSLVRDLGVRWVPLTSDKQRPRIWRCIRWAAALRAVQERQNVGPVDALRSVSCKLLQPSREHCLHAWNQRMQVL